jgi:restriction endonuclease Mrr
VTIKYKLGFTIDSEVMFMLLSKFLPVQDLSVEEVVERLPDPAIRFDKRFDLPKPKRMKRARRGKGHTMNLREGVNAIIMRVLADGEPHSAMECKVPVRSSGYSENGIGSRLERLKAHGVVHQPTIGRWQLTPKGKQMLEAGA